MRQRYVMLPVRRLRLVNERAVDGIGFKERDGGGVARFYSGLGAEKGGPGPRPMTIKKTRPRRGNPARCLSP